MRKAITLAVLAALIFIAIFLNSVFNNLNKPLIHDDDLFFYYFVLDNNLDKLSKFQFGQLFNLRMYYPHKNTLAYNNSVFGQSLLALPFFLLTGNTLISTNLMIITSLFLSFLAMFFLVFHYTKSLISSIVGAVIFNFNPYVMTYFPGTVEMLTLQWIPLIFLTSEKLVEKITWKKSMILAALFFMQLISSFYYFMYLLIIWPIFIFLRVYFGKIKNLKFLHPAIICSILLFILVAYFYIQPYISVRKVFDMTRSINSNIYHSAQFSAFLSKVKTPNEPENHNLSMGWTVYFLVIGSFWLMIKNKFSLYEKLIVRIYLLCFFISVILSFGPYLIIGNFLIPLPYLALYKIVPFFDGMRVPARFIVMANFSAGILSAFCLSLFLKYKLPQNLETSGYKPKMKILILFIISAILVFEYWQKPTEPFPIKPEIVSFYSWLDKSNFQAIVELPMANSFSEISTIGRGFDKDSIYLLYGTLHHKYIVNGTGSYLPEYAYILGDSLTLNFPTTSKIDRLKKMGVNLIVIHADEYKDARVGNEIVSGLEQLNLKKVYESPLIIAFSL